MEPKSDVAQDTCDRIGIIHGGRLRVVGSIADLRKDVGMDEDANLESLLERQFSAKIAAESLEQREETLTKRIARLIDEANR